jgi:5'-nucleotidase/UDP-sugar diphosphatase
VNLRSEARRCKLCPQLNEANELRRIPRILFITILFYPALLFGEEKLLTIIHTNDLHSHLLGFSPNIDYSPLRTGDDQTVGGWARIAAVIKSEKAKRTNPTLVLDAGDFLMGSLFHMVAREEALELRLIKEMGYDVVTLGNHEFDLMSSGLARILVSADQKGGMPEVVSSNLLFNQESNEDDTLEELFKKAVIKPYLIREIQGIRIGIFGILGKDAAEVSPFARPIKFRDPIETSREMVKMLREKKKVHLVICLSHSGLREKKSLSEDDRLAEEVPGIDLIVSGHSHTKLEKPMMVNRTIIVQAGCYGEYVGALDLAYDDGKVKLKEYKLVEIDDTIQADEKIQKRVESFIGLINERVLKQVGLSFDEVLAETDFEIRSENDESNLGNLIADSIRWAINRTDYNEKDPVTKVVVAIESNGMIRDDLFGGKTGQVAVCDLFRTVPLGFSRGDDTMGYPLITCYFYAHEIKKTMEVITSIYPKKGSNFFLQVSGMKFKYNPNRVIFDRVTDIGIGSEEEGYQPLDYSEKNKNLYRVATTIYNATFLNFVGRFTYGILDIIPKDRYGNKITADTSKGNPFDLLLSLRVDVDKEKTGIQELKEWVAVMNYVKSFPDKDGDGISDIPEKYRGKLGRIIREPSWNPISLLSRGTYLTWIAFGMIIGLVFIIGLAIYLFSRKWGRDHMKNTIP